MPIPRFRTIGRECAQLWRYLRFRWKYAFLRAPAEVKKGQILIVSLAHWIPQVTTQAIIAKGFQLKGYEPVILTYRKYRWAQRYFNACGITKFLYFDDYMQQAKGAMDSRSAEDHLGGKPTFAGLFAYLWEGILVGRHVLSTIVRRLAQGSVAFDDPQVKQMLDTLFPESIQATVAARLIFKTMRPDAVLFVEKGYLPYGVIFDVAVENHLNVVQFHHSHRSDLMMMKRYNDGNRYQHSFSLSEKSWETVKALPWTEERDRSFMDELKRSYEQGTWFNRKFLLTNKQIKTPQRVREQLGLDPAKKTAVIFSHVLWDATFFFGTNLFEDYEKWLIATVRAACENPAVNWLVKLHPDYVWKMKSMGDTRPPRDIVALQMNIGSLPDHVQIVPPETDISTYSFFAITDYCITVRGTIGIECPCFGIPVFTAGTGRYSSMGFTNDSTTAEEYLQKMHTIQNFPRLSFEQAKLARKHAHALFERRALKFDTFELQPLQRSDFGHELVLRLQSLQDLRTARDVNTFIEWVLRSKDEDYLASYIA